MCFLLLHHIIYKYNFKRDTRCNVRDILLVELMHDLKLSLTDLYASQQIFSVERSLKLRRNRDLSPNVRRLVAACGETLFSKLFKKKVGLWKYILFDGRNYIIQ